MPRSPTRAPPSSTSSRSAATRCPRPPGLAVVDIWRRERLTERAAALDARLRRGARAAARVRVRRRHPDDRAHGRHRVRRRPRDEGAIPPSRKVAALVREAGLRNGIVTYPGTGMATGTAGDIISLYPPLTFTDEHLDEMARGLRAAFAEVATDSRHDATGGARIHPGEVILVMDHSVITLREGGRPDGAETAHLSMYDVKYSIEVGGGHVVLLRVPSAGIDGFCRHDRARRADAGAPARDRHDRPGARAPADRPAGRRARAVRRRRFGYRFSADGLEVHARWDDCEPPFYAEGLSPRSHRARTSGRSSSRRDARRWSSTVSTPVARPGTRTLEAAPAAAPCRPRTRRSARHACDRIRTASRARRPEPSPSSGYRARGPKHGHPRRGSRLGRSGRARRSARRRAASTVEHARSDTMTADAPNRSASAPEAAAPSG